MSIVVEAPRPTRKLQAERTVESQTLLLDNITWEQYEAIGDALQDRAGLRLTYDSGRLEFMTTSPRHEVYKHWSGRLLEDSCRGNEYCGLAGRQHDLQAERFGCRSGTRRVLLDCP